MQKVHDYATGAELGTIDGALLRLYVEETMDDAVGAVDGAPYGFPGHDIYVDVDVDEYLEAHGYCYAVVDRQGWVQEVVYDLREADDPEVTERMNRLAGYGSDGHRWVLVEGGPCSLGDLLEVDDEEGTATLAG